MLFILSFNGLSLVNAMSFDPENQPDVNSDPLIIQESRIKPQKINPGQTAEVFLKLHLPAGFKAYEDQIKVKVTDPTGFSVGQVQLSPIVEFYDKFSKKMKRGFENQAELRFLIEAPVDLSSTNSLSEVTQISSIDLDLRYQACSESFCLFPQNRKVHFDLVSETQLDLKNPEISSLLGRSLLLSLLVVFVAGILTSFTPCIFPMIPITLAILGHSAERKRSINFFYSLLYVLGIATTYSILGLIAASTGALFGSLLGSSWALSFIAIIFLLMSLGMFGLFEIKLPHALERKLHIKHEAHSQSHIKGFIKAFLSGLVAGLVASPCVGPVLVSILTYVGQTKDMFLGFALLFTYALGLGQIFLLLGAVTEVKTFLPKSGPWMNFSKFIFGTLMLGGFYYYFHLLVPENYFDSALGLGLIILSSVYGGFTPIAHFSPLKGLKKGLLLSTFVIGIAYLSVGLFKLRPYLMNKMVQVTPVSQEVLPFQKYSETAFKQAIESHKPIMIDFYAEWCVACKELEQYTFSNPRVQTLLQDFVLFKVDATNDSPELSELKKLYQIKGLPSVQFYNLKGEWKNKLTLTEFEEVSQFAERLKKVNE
jgi:thiol:disulfide interchange protein DsbD